jgi:tetratricopeptide (TPR) repeat protein
MTPPLQRAVHAVLLVTLLVCCYYSYTTFYGKYFFVMASRDAKTTTEHEEWLREALRHDPSYGYANQAIARLLMRQQKYGAALEYQQQGMETFRPVRSYQQLGTIYERLRKLDEAEQAFTSALNMNPRDSDTLEHLAVIALEKGSSKRVNELTERILEFDMNNVDVYYVRARDAERTGQYGVAYANLQRVAAAISRNQVIQKGSLFTKEEIAKRLTALQARSAQK